MHDARVVNQVAVRHDSPHGENSCGQRSYKIKTITRKRLRLITQVITGHCALNYHLHKIKRAETPTCEKCNDEDETMGHFLGKCPALSELRMEHLDTRYSNIQDVFATNDLNNIIN